MAKTPGVASLKVRPVRSAAIQSAFGTHTPDVVPFHVKMMPWSKKKSSQGTWASREGNGVCRFKIVRVYQAVTTGIHPPQKLVF
jgi:hypothetical protein